MTNPENSTVTRPVLNSMLLGSTDPDRLKTWYRDAFHARVDGYGNLDLGGFGLVIEHRDDVAAQAPEPGRFIVNFAVDDIEATAEHLRTLAVDWLVEPEDRGIGKFATLTDPDGNYVQLIQMKPEYYANR
ncbi:VOC family protein [Kribbella lupini]|uniref:VOC domain-containing protein n=1 Tax=Kribbella lupini TaxID=291602 RepID=A0ABN2BIW7_9ACTN